MQVVCSPKCAAEYAAKARTAAADKEHKARKVAAKTRAEWMREAQSVFNAYIRKRDEALPCISCGRHHTGQYHAGHYLSVGARPELRFEEDNVHKQCQPCNTHLSGNLVLYRAALIRKVGQDRVEWLEGPHEAKHYTVDDLKAIIAEYKAKTKHICAK